MRGSPIRLIFYLRNISFFMCVIEHFNCTNFICILFVHSFTDMQHGSIIISTMSDFNFSICSLSMVDVLIDIQPLILQERNLCWSHCPQMSIEYICHELLEWLQLSFSKEARCEITADQCMHPKQCFHQSRLFVVQNCSNLRHSDVSSVISGSILTTP